MQKTTFIFTGGTIDSYYDADKCTPVPHPESIIPSYIEQRLFLDPDIHLEYIQLCSKDSRDISDVDRDGIVQILEKSQNSRFIITHGTYTLFETARFIQKHLTSADKKIILTGSMIPLDGYYHSDGHFNLGFALGVIEEVKKGIWVCIKGKCYSPDDSVELH